MRQHLLLVDTSALFYRSHHAMGALARKSDGMSTGGLLGYSRALMAELRKGAYTHALACMDPGGKLERHEIDPGYKFGRSASVDDPIARQKTWLGQIPGLFGMRRMIVSRFEADDLIATGVTLARAAGMQVTVLGIDKDLYSLVGDDVSIIDGKGTTIDHAAVIAKWGVRPDQLTDLQTLMGDTTDAVLGLPGVGQKTAAALLAVYGTPEAVPYSALPLRARKAVPEAQLADRLALSRKLVTLSTTVPMGQPEEWAIAAPNIGGLMQLCEAMEFVGLRYEIEQWNKVGAATW